LPLPEDKFVAPRWDLRIDVADASEAKILNHPYQLRTAGIFIGIPTHPIDDVVIEIHPAFLAQGIRGVAGHRFGNLSAAETTELYQALKSPAKR